MNISLTKTFGMLLLFLVLANCSSSMSPGGKTTEVSFLTHDGITLAGQVFGFGSTAVILSHTESADQTSWWPFARILRDKGYKVLTYDFRGYRDSSGDMDLGNSGTDLDSAVDFVLSEGASKIFLIGAGVGGTASLKVGTRAEVSGLITLSSSPISNNLDVIEDIPNITSPKLFLASKQDLFHARSLDVFEQISGDPKERHRIEGESQGTEMLLSDNGPLVKGLIVDFLRRYSE